MCGCVGGEELGEGPAPVFVAPQDSLDSDGSLVQGPTPLYLQQGVLVFLEQKSSHHITALPHPKPLPAARALSPEVRISHTLPGRAGRG